LSQILEEEVPEKYYLSAKACAGILRRAKKRNWKGLAHELKEALERQALCDGEAVARGGGKGALVSNEKSLTLATANDHVLFVPDKARSLTARAGGSPCIDRGPQIISVYQNSGYGKYTKGDICQTLQAAGGDCGGGSETLVYQKTVRRLTPTECERLQGLKDGYTDGGSDTARYKALGNGMAQPCADYVIRRIVEVCVA
jgi:site-specific DNA-cytosine methylase